MVAALWVATERGNMTNIEEKIMAKYRRKMRQKKILGKELDVLKEVLKDRVIDIHYADSWEQVSQINKDIDRLNAQITAIENFIDNIYYDHKVINDICRDLIMGKTYRFRGIEKYIKYRSSGLTEDESRNKYIQWIDPFITSNPDKSYLNLNEFFSYAEEQFKTRFRLKIISCMA